MLLKYNILIDDKVIKNRIKNLINQTYKLLPSREQGLDWEKPLETIMEELSGMSRLLMDNFSDSFFCLLVKMEGLYSLKQEQDFLCFRRTIFECLNLMNTLEKSICLF